MSSSIIEARTPVRVVANAMRGVFENKEFKKLVAEVKRGARVVSLAGLTAEPARALVVAALEHATRRRIGVLTETNRDLERWERDVRFWSEAIKGEADKASVLILPASESDPYAGASPHAETLEERAMVLWRLAHANAGGKRAGDIVLLSARALARRTVSPDEINRAGAFLRRDEDFALEDLVARLVASGYVREDPVRGVGSFSARGGIVDIWSVGHDSPVRVEFFGDTVDSIRKFDPETQLSIEQLKEMEIVPMRETATGKDDLRLWAVAARERFSDARFERTLADRTVYADDGETFAGWEWLIGVSHPRTSNVFEYLDDAVIVTDEPSQIENNLRNFYDTLARRYTETLAADEIAVAPDELYLKADELRALLDARQRVEMRTLGRIAALTDDNFAAASGGDAVSSNATNNRVTNAISNTDDTANAGDVMSLARDGMLKNLTAMSAPMFLFPAAERAPEIELRVQPTRRYHGRVADLARDLKRTTKSKPVQALFVMPSTGLGGRVAEMLADYEVGARFVPLDETGSGDDSHAPLITVGRLSGGFEMPGAKLAIFTESNLFDDTIEGQVEQRAARATPAQSGKRKSTTQAFLSDFRDLKPGDYVVHIDHGIAKFLGLNILNLQGRRGEFMLLSYAEDAKLYVPVERLDLVQRYSSAEAQEPNLDKLGGLGWQKTKAKAKRAMRDMADELLKLYAERKMVTGYAFSSDSPWQAEFEEGFPYQLTVDQATAIEDAKTDMEKTLPMDRLLCGDVGYGKTEVAMRAAFKAVMDGKQVAVLTPTTVLAYQHFETFKARFAAFPVTIDLLSRFRSPKEQKEAVKKIEDGAVDIIIGTHRLLSKDVRFRDLGLVVVDEEQRFGVAHKERLKQLKKKVDVLTLSATPIPRTLNMALMGLRDMSVIETPPRDRLAINTQVVQFSESVIKSAVELELGRGGQAFFIHNRVETIDTIAALVARLVPNARVVFAHGQMNEQEMEQVMLDFVDYKYDVLVSTTIIENGIDIPRANTILINRADQYGLAQLYQLRGRVGRSNRRAYAYLLIPSELTLTPIARRRLAAIREFSDLGAGFRVAALDLELRGAGSLLGGQQSGNMDALGFDLYTQMLERTVAELQGETIADEVSVSLNLQVDVSIPEHYISDMGQRLRTYKRIASARDDATLDLILRETKDRYGNLPESVIRLFEYGRLRRTGERLNVVSIDRTPSGLAIKLGDHARVAPEKLLDLVNRRAGVSFAPSGVLRVELNDEEIETIVEIARGLLLEIAATD
ncbi:MAG: transcription-repair coupling factor [Pyrinomonadaceae bacterium MAG19_C2-C3]|nr:transcription-repair coupling factor [Pyrinomonadaceae bacterium MAG19_C2-C3]